MVVSSRCDGEIILSLTAKERILNRLYEFRFQKPDNIIPLHICQRGISEDLRIHKTDVSKLLIQLEKEGLVTSKLARVRDIPQRTKGYYITEKGEEEAKILENLQTYDLDYELQEEAEIYRRLGRKKWRKGEHQQALKFFEDGLNLCRNRYPDVEGNILIDKGNVLEEMGQYEESIAIHKDALVLLKSYERSYELCRLYNNLAVTHNRIQQYEKSLKYLKKSLALNGTLKDKGYCYFISAYALAHLGQVEEASEFSEKGLNAAKKLQDDIMISGYWEIKGVIYRFRKEFKESIKYFDKALKMLPKGLMHLQSEYLREKQITLDMMAVESK